MPKEATLSLKLLLQVKDRVPRCHRALGLAVSIVLQESANLLLLGGSQVIGLLAQDDAKVGADCTLAGRHELPQLLVLRK